MLTAAFSMILIGLGVLSVCVRAVLQEIQNTVSARPSLGAVTRSFQGNSQAIFMLGQFAWLAPFGVIVLVMSQVALYSGSEGLGKTFDLLSWLVANSFFVGIAIVVSKVAWLEDVDRKSMRKAVIDQPADQR